MTKGPGYGTIEVRWNGVLQISAAKVWKDKPLALRVWHDRVEHRVREREHRRVKRQR